MKTIIATELKSILDQHRLWVETNRVQGTRANLTGANLKDANLWRANLNSADLTGANLGGANLGGANLEYANLTGANLTGANLGGANLEYANLKGANLLDANLTDANLWRANLNSADLTGADLTGADLTSADLTGANLTSANLTNTVLDEKKKEETKMNMENENGFILSSEEKDMVLEYRKKTAKEKKIKEIRQTATALLLSFRAIDQIARGGTYELNIGLEANTKLLQEVLRLFGVVHLKLHSTHFCDGRLLKHTLSFAMPSLD